MEHDERYRRAREFYDVVTGLWDSWAEDAFIRNVETGEYFDPARMHVLNHQGPYYSVRGPLNIARPIQGWPVIVQAGASDAGRQLAAETAEMVFAGTTDIAGARALYADVKGRMAKLGRNPDHLKILPGAFVVVGDTLDEAREKRALLDSLVHEDSAIASLSIALGHDASRLDPDGPLPEIPESNASQSGRERAIALAKRENLTVRQLAQRLGGYGGPVLIGTPSMIADQMEEWLLTEASDGFNVMFPYLPGGLDDFVDRVVPELQRRGIFRREYEANTLRENLDYSFQGSQWIVLSPTSPPGATIYANMLVKLNPYYTVGTNPENILQVNMTPTETLAPNQVFIHTTHGNYTNPTVNSDGTLTLPQLLQPGDWMRWEVRIDSGQFQAVAKKWELNSLNVVDPTTIQWTKLDKEGKPQPVPTKWVMAADQSELVGVSQASAGTPVPYNGTPVPITATTIYEGTLTVTAANAYQPGDQVLLGGTAEEFLNGSTVTVATSTASQFTAALARPNYVNNADTGTARGEPRLVFPGLRLAIGDNVVVGDQCAIIVSPTLTETYEVFGSKENLTFTLEIKANDMQTSSNLAEMIKQELLVMRRTNTEADGLTIFEVTRSFVGTARDNSATAPSYVNTVTVTASADWKVYVPLVTRLVSLEVNEVMTVQTDFQGQLQMAPRLEAFGAASFIPYYG